MRSGGNTKTGISAATVGALLLATPLLAQDQGGLAATLSFSQGISLSKDGDSFGQSDIGFSIASETRSQTFAFDFGTTIEQRLDGGLDTELVSPTVGLSYSIQSRQSLFESSFRFRQSDADAFVQNEDDLPGILVLDEGTREDQSANVSFAFGREARFGGSVTLGTAQSTYTGTSSTELVDTRTDRAGIDLRFEIDRRITGTLGYSIAQIDRDIGTDVTNEKLRVGAQLAINQTLNANLSFGRSRITREEGAVETVTLGSNYGISLVQERPSGDLSFSLSSDITEAGRRTSATVGRTLETRRGAFSAKLGATESDTSKLRPLAQLRYTETLARGSFGIDLSQDFSSTTAGLDALNSRVRLDWNQDLTRSSRFGTDLTYQETDVFGSDDDTSRLDLGLQYTQDLTADWALTTRYVHSRFDANSGTERRENDLFIGLETTLGWRP